MKNSSSEWREGRWPPSVLCKVGAYINLELLRIIYIALWVSLFIVYYALMKHLKLRSESTKHLSIYYCIWPPWSSEIRQFIILMIQKEDHVEMPTENIKLFFLVPCSRRESNLQFFPFYKISTRLSDKEKKVLSIFMFFYFPFGPTTIFVGKVLQNEVSLGCV